MTVLKPMLLDMELEEECDTEAVVDSPVVDTEPLDLDFETQLVDDLNSTVNMLNCGAAREFGEEVAPDSEDEMSRGMKQVDVVKGLFRSRTSGRVRADEVELNKKMDIDVIPADESSAGWSTN